MNFKPMDDFLEYLVSWRIPGVDLLVQQDHQTVFRAQHGFRDLETRQPVRGDELYFMYSCSKVITVTAAMQLLEQGRFLLNDPVSAYLPEYADLQVLENGSLRPAKTVMRIHHLFSMTGGLNYNLDAPAIRLVRERTQGRCPTREVARAIASEPLSFDPGTHWQYSLCHDVLAALVEVVSGRRFADYVREHIFLPLGMTRSAYHAEGIPEASFAKQYMFDDSAGSAKPVPLTAGYILGPDYDSGGAGVISSVEDFGRFTDALACGGVGADGKRILSRAAMDLMRINRLDEACLRDFNWEQMSGYGYGLGVRTMMRPEIGGALSPVGEFGWGGAAGAYVLIDPERRLSVFYAQHLLNNQEPFVHPRLRNLTYACLGS